MQATINILHQFSGITVGNYICHAGCGTKSAIEYTPEYTIIFLLKGSFRHQPFRQSDFLTSETILFKKPGFDYCAIHEHRIQDDCFYIDFGEDVLEQLASTFSKPVREFLKKPDVASIVLKNDPWKHFVAWHLSKNNADGIALQAQDAIVRLISGLLGDDKELKADKNTVLHDSVDRAKQFIVKNYKDDISLQQIAEASHTSTFHFSRVFKQGTSLTPHQFLVDIRIRQACNLLLNTDLSIAEVAYDTGFGNVEYFFTVFKRKTGTTPMQFRSRGEARGL